MSLGAIKRVRCILAKVQSGRRQRSLFPQWQHLYSKQYTGASHERLFNMPSIFPKACSSQPPGKRLTWWQTVSAISKSDGKWDSAEWRRSCSYPWAHCHSAQFICQSMSLSRPQERRYSACLYPAQATMASHWDLQIELPSCDVHSEDVDKHSDIEAKF